LGTNGRWREGAVNQGKPVSTHYIKDIMCKASITGDLISLGNCSQSSPFMTIFVFSVPKSVKGRTFHLRSQKFHNMLTSVINLSTVSAVSTLWTSRFHATRAAVLYLTLCDDVPPTTYGTNGLLELWNKRERKNCVALRWSLLIFFFLPRRNSPYWAKDLLIIEASRSHSDTPQFVGLLWTSSQPVAETSTWQHTTLSRDRHPCPRRDSNPQSQQASGRRPTP
jgi:hypothetical protein